MLVGEQATESARRDAPATGRLPDFVIAGAMKSGTTSIRHLLAHHPDIFIPDREIFFFDIDDIEQHPDFFVYADRTWAAHDFEARQGDYLPWYASFFRDAHPHQLIGEDSTTYLASSRAPRRIADLLPDARIIVLLRDPASRTYSHYWHLVLTGRVTHAFEACLQYTPGTLLQRSLYRSQIEAYRRYFPAERLHVILFEEFVRDTPRVMAELTAFLGVPSLDLAALETHRGAALVPRFPRLWLVRNHLLRRRALGVYASHLVDLPARDAMKPGLVMRAVDKVHRTVNPVRPVRPPPMRAETRRFLNGLFARENRDLSELIGKRVEDHWYRD